MCGCCSCARSDRGRGAAVVRGQDHHADDRLRSGLRQRRLRPAHCTSYRQANPGQPNVVPQNMPGAGSFKAANYLFQAAPKDGTSLGYISQTAATEELLGSQAIQFKTAQFNWIGRIGSYNNMVIFWHTSRIKTIADALKMDVDHRRDRRRLGGLHLSQHDEQDSGNEVQDRQRLSGHRANVARDGARRGRGCDHGLVSGQDQQARLGRRRRRSTSWSSS